MQRSESARDQTDASLLSHRALSTVLNHKLEGITATALLDREKARRLERANDLMVDAFRNPVFIGILNRVNGEYDMGHGASHVSLYGDSDLFYNRMVTYIPVMNRLGYRVTLYSHVDDPVLEIARGPFAVGPENYYPAYETQAVFWPPGS